MNRRSNHETRPPLAYSYCRFSTTEQMKGDSLRRQTADTESWCRKNGIALDTSLTLRDLGVSAFRGKHRSDKAALGHFLEAVRQGKVPKGSYLVIENLDRLSREEERTALRLWLDILDAGVNIVQLHPETVFRHERSDMTDIIRAIIELSRGHSESRMKSVRNSAAWDAKFLRARENGEVLTHTLPAWVKEVKGQLVLIPERAKIVRRIFDMACSGYGQGTIARLLRQEGIPAFGVSGDWTRSYVGKILHDRRSLGELQPRQSKKDADEHSIPGYYPTVISEQEFMTAQVATAARRRGKPGRIGSPEDGCANLFGGLLRNARDGGTYITALRRDKGKDGQWRYRRVLQTMGFENAKCPAYSFSLPDFERGILSQLREIDPTEILPQDKTSDESVLRNELAWVRERKAALEAELLKGDLAAIALALRQLEARDTELVRALDDAQEQQVKPMVDTWQDVKTLTDLLDRTEDLPDIRLRLRAAIRRIVESVWLVVVPRRRDRLAYAQVFFTAGGSRTYVLVSRPSRGNGRPGGRREGRFCVAHTVKVPDDVPAGSFYVPQDLREPSEAARVQRMLERFPDHVLNELLQA